VLLPVYRNPAERIRSVVASANHINVVRQAANGFTPGVARSGYVQPFFDGMAAFTSVAHLTPFVLLLQPRQRLVSRLGNKLQIRLQRKRTEFPSGDGISRVLLDEEPR
jgi:hypothetical protein